MSAVYTTDDFCRLYERMGYGASAHARRWMAENGMQAAEDADFQRCYDACDAQLIGHRSRSSFMGNGNYGALRLEEADAGFD